MMKNCHSCLTGCDQIQSGGFLSMTCNAIRLRIIPSNCLPVFFRKVISWKMMHRCRCWEEWQERNGKKYLPLQEFLILNVNGSGPSVGWSPVHMMPDAEYDVAIIGGGLAGLAAAILLSKHGHSVALFEKEKFPFRLVPPPIRLGFASTFNSSVALNFFH